MFKKTFEIRWNDVDMNRHLANSSYAQYGSNSRMGILDEMGFTTEVMKKNALGPVLFYEQIYYFKEIFFGDEVTVETVIKGASEDAMFFEFEHNFYNKAGNNCARILVLGAWIDMRTRKLTGLPTELTEGIDKYKSPEFKILAKADTRAHGQFPKK